MFGEDYLGISPDVVMFDSCETSSCSSVAIVNDDILEGLESFSAVLQGTQGLDTRITLDPVNAEIEIIDDDGEFLTFSLQQSYLLQQLYLFLYHSGHCGFGADILQCLRVGWCGGSVCSRV